MELSALRYLPYILIIGLIFGFIWKQWNFFKGVLSEGTPVVDAKGEIVRDKDGNPIILGSTTRVLAFMFGITMIIAELYIIIKTEKFEYQHLVAFLVSIGVLLGFIKVTDWINAKKGNITGTND